MRRAVALFLLSMAGVVAANDAHDAGAKIHEYFELFNAKDTEAIANEIYSTPVHVGGGSGHSIYADPAAAIASLNDFYEQIEGQGWTESVIDDLQICQLSDTLALVDTRFSRITHEGKPIPPAVRTTLYVVQKIDDDWRIVAFYGHDADKRPACN